MTEVNILDALLRPCNCEAKYTIERHGKGHVLYHGRCNHRHGYNLVELHDKAANCDFKLLEKLLNIGAKEYAKNFSEWSKE